MKNCTSQYGTGTFLVGASESTTQSCQTGYSGNKVLTHVCQSTGLWGAVTTKDTCVITPIITCTGSWNPTIKFLVGQTESNTQACTGGQTGNITNSHVCQSTGAWNTTSTTNTCACPSGQTLQNGVCTTPAPTSCQGSWHSQSYAIGVVEEQFANSCPSGTTGQVRQFHTCQAGGVWSATAQSDTCTAATVPPVPTGINFNSLTTGVQLTWPSVSSATSYIIYKGSPTSTQIGTSISGDFTDPDVTIGVGYCYQIASYSNFNNANVTSGKSGSVCNTYNGGQIPLFPPGNLVAARSFTPKGISLTWNNAATADSYLIYRNGSFLAATGTGSSFFDASNMGLVTGLSYCYKIRSQRGSTVSADSLDTCSLAP